jgi:hypothetical protein
MQANNSIQVWNNGNGIPVEMHKEERVYVPELIFGHLLTSSNYDDKEKKVRAWPPACVRLRGCGVLVGGRGGGGRAGRPAMSTQIQQRLRRLTLVGSLN